MPSSSHPTDHHVEDITPPSQPTTSIPPSSQPISPLSSPLHGHTESPIRAEVIKPKRVDLGTLAHTYQRGHRHVFSPQIVGGALPFSPTKLVHKGKEEMTEAEV